MEWIISSKSSQTKAPVIDEDTINAGEPTSANIPAILRVVSKEQHNDANQEQKSKGSLSHLIGQHVNGVSVHYLRTILLQEVQDAGLDEDTATIYDMEDMRKSTHGIIRSKGAQHTCPRDGKLGAAYVDTIQGEDFVGTANVMLGSYCWSYRIEDIVKTLEDKCKANERDPKQTYVWICYLCNNQHRVDNHVPFEQFRDFFGTGDIFGSIVTSVGTIWSMPMEQNKAMIESLSRIDNLLNALAKTTIENAKASQAEDKKNILALVEESVGQADLNIIVNSSTRKSIIGVLKKEEQLRARRSRDASTDLDHARLCCNIGNVLRTLDDFNEALKMCNKGRAIREKVLGKEHPDTAASNSNIGLVMLAMGDNAGALEMCNQGLAIHLKVLGKEHPHTAESYNKVWLVKLAMGDNDGALEMCRKSLAIHLKVFGKDHPLTAKSSNNIGLVMTAMGDNDGALEMCNKGLVINLKVFGEEHPHTAESYNNIGCVKLAMGNYDGALEMCNTGLAICLKVFGKEHHPLTAESYNNIGCVMEAMGDYNGALEMCHTGLAIHLKVFGKEGPLTAAFYNNIGYAMEAIGDYDGTLEMYNKSFAIHEKELGEHHPDTILSSNAVAAIMKTIADME